MTRVTYRAALTARSPAARSSADNQGLVKRAYASLDRKPGRASGLLKIIEAKSDCDVRR
jgi:hypothetical protein